MRYISWLVALGFLSIFVVGCGGAEFGGLGHDTGGAAVHRFSKDGFVKDWLVLGAFDNSTSDTQFADGSYHVGFSTDYLVSIGGEANARFTTETEVEVGGESFRVRKAKAGGQNIINLDTMFEKVDNKVAYAFCYLNSDKDQTARFYLSSDDGAKVWVNGDLVHKNYVARGIGYRQDSFEAELVKGLNPIMVKVDDRVRDWGFVLEAFDEKGSADILAAERRRRDFHEFLSASVIPKVGNPWDATFVPGKFPKVDWDRPYLVEKVAGKFELKTRWFDGELNEVKKPESPGRYAFYVEGVTPKGVKIRRAATVYCRPEDWLGWSEKPRGYLDFFPLSTADKQAWEEHKDAISVYAGRIFLESALRQQSGAVLLAYLDEMEATGGAVSALDTPMIRDQEYHLALKQKILGTGPHNPGLELPRKRSVAAAVLRKGSEKKAGFKAGTVDNIREVCREWFEESKEPFDILVARNGVVIIHEAFGEGADGKFTLDKKTEMASITKLVTGMMFAQFMDQGLIDIDDPVGKYLADFPVEGDKAITLRHCFTHTTGLYGHSEYRGLHNPWLENVIYNSLENLKVGKVHNYNGMGYDLAGRTMEVVAGKSIFRMMRENMFDPLGMWDTELEEDLGWSTHSTAGDFGVLGQMLLNKGSYGELEFFSAETFERMLPVKLEKYYPEVKGTEWGIGITWMRQGHPDAGKGDVPKDATILSRNVIGHGSATSAILRVDLDNDLVITQSRRRGGKKYDKYLTKFLTAIDEGLIND